jgi:hypothetical protein
MGVAPAKPFISENMHIQAIRSNSHRLMLCLACALALAGHFGAILWIQGWRWESSSSSHFKEKTDSNEVVRSQQLMQLFQEIVEAHPCSQLSVEHQMSVEHQNVSQNEEGADSLARGEMSSDRSHEGHSSLFSACTSILPTVLPHEGALLETLPGVVVDGGQAGALSVLKQEPLSSESHHAKTPVDASPKAFVTSYPMQETGVDPQRSSIACSNDFTLQVEYTPKPSGTGYLFRLSLLPKGEVTFRRIAHNIFFLIDRSHSIRAERYEISKSAVAEALAFLQEGDTFNIVLFDDKVVRLSEKNLIWNEENLVKAKEFLTQQPYRGVFASTDLYSSLGHMIPSAVTENEVNTAIVLSDGDTDLKREKQRLAVAQWTQQNQGRVSLYSVVSGQGSHLALLDLLSVVNKGGLYSAPLDEGLPSALAQLMQTIQNPIGKEISTSAVAVSEAAEIFLFPRIARLPNLYEHAPYVVYGSIDRLEDFHLFLQGKHYQHALDIKQTVSFRNAQLVQEDSLVKMWVLQHAYDLYDRYLRLGDVAALHEANRLLTSYHLPTPF